MEREGTEGEEDEGRGEEGKGEEEREQEEGGGEKAETERGEKGEDEDEEEEMGDERRGGGGCFSTVPGSGCFPQRPKYKPPGAPGCPWLMGRGPRLSSKSPRSSCSILTNVHHYASPTIATAPGSPTCHIFHHLENTTSDSQAGYSAPTVCRQLFRGTQTHSPAGSAHQLRSHTTGRQPQLGQVPLLSCTVPSRAIFEHAELLSHFRDLDNVIESTENHRMYYPETLVTREW